MTAFHHRLAHWRAHRTPLLWLLATALLVLFTLGQMPTLAHAAPVDDKPAQGQTYTIATDTTWAPFEFEEAGKLVGIDMDLINAVARDQGFTVDIKVLGFDGALAAVQAGQADAVMAGMSITDERKQSFDFSNPYFDSGIQMAVAEADTAITTYADLKGKTVSAKTGTEGFDFAQKLATQYGFTVTGFQDAADAYNDVTSGHSAAVFDDYPILAYAIQTGNSGMKTVTPQEKASSYGMGVAKGQNPELVAAFNLGLQNLINSGEYQQILDRYLGDNAPEAKAIGGGLAVLGNTKLSPGNPGDLVQNPNFPVDTPKTKGKFTIATDTVFAPFEFKDQSGNNVGIDMDLIQAIAANQGFEVDIRSLGFDAALAAVSGGQADGVIAGMSITDQRKQTFDFSDPYFQSGVQMAVGKDSTIASYDDLKGQNVAAKTGTVGFDFATKLSQQVGFTVSAFQDSADVYNDVSTGHSVAAFEDAPVLQYGIASGAVPLKIVTDPEPGADYGFAVQKGENQELLQMFNAGLKNAKDSGAYQQIVDRYLKVQTAEESTSFFTLLAQIFPTLMKGLGATLLATALSIILGLILGVIFGILKLSGNWFLRGIAGVYVNIFRGTPVIVQAFFFYFGVPAFVQQVLGLPNFTMTAIVAGVITLSLNSGAYITEIVRGGVQSVDPGQMEASRSLGLGWMPSMRRVVMPQAFKIMTPNLINQFIITLKDTSLLSVLGFAELTYQGRIVIASTFRSFEIWIVVAIIYFIVIWLLTMLSNWVDRKLNK